MLIGSGREMSNQALWNNLIARQCLFVGGDPPMLFIAIKSFIGMECMNNAGNATPADGAYSDLVRTVHTTGDMTTLEEDSSNLAIETDNTLIWIIHVHWFDCLDWGF